MGLRDRVNTWLQGEQRSIYDQYFPWANLVGGQLYPLGLNTSMPNEKQEEIQGDFAGFVAGAYKANGVVFAVMLVRMMLFAQARFQFQALRNGKPAELFGDASLAILEHPWPGATTGDLLSRMIQDADLAGNAFVIRTGDRLQRLRPDWVSIVLSADSYEAEAEVIGYLYFPGGKGQGSDPVAYQRSEVAHFAPVPDPTARYRGMSWLSPIVREVMADSAARDHKLKFFENGATPNLVVKVNQPDPAKFKDWVKLFKEAEPAGRQAYKTLFLDSGSDATVIGANLRQIDFKTTQGAGETRIAAAGGVPPVIVGLSEGLQAATYSNYSQARRRLSDGTAWPLWQNAAGSLETIVPPPRTASRLWVDVEGIPFLREDQKDLAEIHQLETQQIRTLTDSGWTPESILTAVTAGDMSLLVHSGLDSVQLQSQSSSIAALVKAGWDADAAVDAVVANDLTKLKGKFEAPPPPQLPPTNGQKPPVGVPS